MRLPLLLLTCPVLFAQAPEGKPVLSFDRVHHDFGKIGADHKVVARFRATNKGNAALQIKGLNPSCGCTSTVTGQWYLKPGESTDLEIGFNPAGFRGITRKHVQVISDDPVNPVIQLSFEAEVVMEVMPNTTALFFQEIPRSGTRHGVIRLSSGNGQPVKVTDTKAAGAPYLSATVKGEGNDALVDILLDGRKVPPGKREGVDTLSINTSNPRVPQVNISIQWEMKSPIQAQPAKVAWVESAGKDQRAVVVLKHAEGKPFRVTGAKATHGQLRVEGLGKAAQAQQELTVILGAAARAGHYNERITLSLDDPEQPELELKVTAVLR